MVAKIMEYEENLAVVIDKPIAEKYHITRDTHIEFKEDGENLVLAKQEDSRKAKIQELLELEDAQYGEVYAKLAK